MLGLVHTLSDVGLWLDNDSIRIIPNYVFLSYPGRGAEEAATRTVCPVTGAGGETAESGVSARGGTTVQAEAAGCFTHAIWDVCTGNTTTTGNGF